ncbi:MAG: ABC transporter ATP-binding protein [Bacteroidia bacterium]
MPETKPPKKFNTPLLVRIFGLAKPYKKLFYFALILTLGMAFIGPYRPYLIQYTLDKYVALNDAKGLIFMTTIIFGLLIINSFMQLGSTIITNYLGQTIIKDLRNKVFRHLASLRLKFFDKTPVGTLVTRTVNDIETVSDIFSEGMINIVGDILQIVFILFLMFYTDWKLSLVSLSVLPFLLYSSYWFKEAVRMSFEDVRNQVARLNTFVQEHLTGMQIVQIFNREDEEFNKFKEINKAHRDANIRSVFYYSVFFPVVEVISAISIGLIVWYGSKGIINNSVSPGVMIAFIMYINMFFRPIRQLADRFNSLQMGMVASERVFKLIDDKSFVEPNGQISPNKIEGNVEFKQVWFAYNDDNYVLKNISFNLKAGKTLALVGATGAGKSSIINLLSRFYEINKGDIFIDGYNLKDLNTQWLRQNISVVLQDVFLFSGSIFDNVKLYNKNLTDDEIIKTAKLLGAHDFIEKLPNGYNQNVHERGATLSVGQRQLISFIRAMVTNPAILVLDEATSSVDQETEEIIQLAIAGMMKNRTSIVIAHRLSTIVNADEIIVLDKGQIVERGNHQTLLQNDGYYRKLYEHQFAVV